MSNKVLFPRFGDDFPAADESGVVIAPKPWISNELAARLARPLVSLVAYPATKTSGWWGISASSAETLLLPQLVLSRFSHNKSAGELFVARRVRHSYRWDEQGGPYGSSTEVVLQQFSTETGPREQMALLVHDYDPSMQSLVVRNADGEWQQPRSTEDHLRAGFYAKVIRHISGLTEVGGPTRL